MLKRIAVGIAASLVLVACSTPAPSPSPSPTSPAPSESPTGNVLPPIPITKAGDVTVSVGDNLNVTTPNVTKVTTDNPAVLRVSQPYSDGSADFNGGALVLAPGKAKLTVFGGTPGGEMYSVNVTAKASTRSGSPSGLQ
ncbi:MAG: hypothetical protein U0990_04855 [Candidatus Nanopelagicales bacterium]|nr:hypothetical protein [Candidatus Nanopelagicales bacterium]MDZ4249402.1 hypothetical protein [Candidatus Nanopelagicales bacterium]MDZ7577669.1 hypothetical protein [Candidatus Nanopelagicales bacterium]